MSGAWWGVYARCPVTTCLAFRIFLLASPRSLHATSASFIYEISNICLTLDYDFQVLEVRPFLFATTTLVSLSQARMDHDGRPKSQHQEAKLPALSFVLFVFMLLFTL